MAPRLDWTGIILNPGSNHEQWRIRTTLDISSCEHRLRLAGAEGLSAPVPVAIGRVSGRRFEAMLKASPDQVVGTGIFAWPTVSASGDMRVDGDELCLMGRYGAPTALAIPALGSVLLGALAVFAAVASLLSGPRTGQEWGLLMAGGGLLTVGSVFSATLGGLAGYASRTNLIDGLATLVEGQVQQYG